VLGGLGGAGAAAGVSVVTKPIGGVAVRLLLLPAVRRLVLGFGSSLLEPLAVPARLLLVLRPMPLVPPAAALAPERLPLDAAAPAIADRLLLGSPK
jgi:hypothetical protein